jgi:hypothetical protein
MTGIQAWMRAFADSQMDVVGGRVIPRLHRNRQCYPTAFGFTAR